MALVAEAGERGDLRPKRTSFLGRGELRLIGMSGALRCAKDVPFVSGIETATIHPGCLYKTGSAV
jgi:hypothetical protein